MAASLPTVARSAFLIAVVVLPLCPQALPATQQAQLPAWERELQRAIESAGNDRVALARNLEEYLQRFPDSPRRTQVFRALIEVCLKLDDPLRAIEFAERFIALEPEDSAMMLLAAELLEEQGDPRSLTRAVGYVTRILDRVEKETPGAAESSAEWADGRAKLLTAVFLARARLQIALRQYDEAAADLRAAAAIGPTAEGQLLFGEVAELQSNYTKAIDHYVLAYFMPDSIGREINRQALRHRLANVWRLRFGSDAGLQERLFVEFNRSMTPPAAPEQPAANAGVNDVFSFRLRRPGGSELSMADYRGKLLVLHFWASWSPACREVERLFDQAAARFRDRRDVAFLALSTDTDEQAAADSLRGARGGTPVAYADGLERLFQVPVVPTVLIVSPAGRVVYRRSGFIRERFLEELVSAVERHLARQ